METLWIVLGVIVLVGGLLDLFLTVLDYDEAGLLTPRLWTLQWLCLRSIAQLTPQRWRQFLLRQTTGLQIILSATFWVGCVVVGFGFIYLGLMYGKHFQYDGASAGIFDAIYLSMVDLATLGTSLVSPASNLALVLTAVEGLSAAMLITLVLGFLLSVYQVVHSMKTLCATLAASESSAGDSIASLVPYFPRGQPVGLDSHLQSISDSLWSYTDGLRIYHIAYYSQSGRQNYSLPYVLHMLSGTLCALRWGLPSEHPASYDPSLVRLSNQFERFADYMQPRLGWSEADAPEELPFEDFSSILAGSAKAPDAWVERFSHLNREMARLARLDAAAADIRNAYERYRQWLPFAWRAEKFTLAVSRHLDYQPNFRAD